MFAVFAAPFPSLPKGMVVVRVAAVALTLEFALAATQAHAARTESAPEAAADALVVASADTPRAQFEVSTATLPRFDNVDASTQTNRIDMRLLSPGRSGVGVALGMNNAVGAGNTLVSTLTPSRSVDLGLHWRHTFDSSYRFDVTAYRKMPNADAISMIESHDPTYGARVEMGFGSNSERKGFVADRGFLGFQLEGGARLSVKRKNGGPMLYYRNQF